MAEKKEKPELTVPPMADEPGGEGVKPAEQPAEKKGAGTEE